MILTIKYKELVKFTVATKTVDSIMVMESTAKVNNALFLSKRPVIDTLHEKDLSTNAYSNHE